LGQMPLMIDILDSTGECVRRIQRD
jgi:hypothetical protein